MAAQRIIKAAGPSEATILEVPIFDDKNYRTKWADIFFPMLIGEHDRAVMSIPHAYLYKNGKPCSGDYNKPTRFEINVGNVGEEAWEAMPKAFDSCGEDMDTVDPNGYPKPPFGCTCTTSRQRVFPPPFNEDDLPEQVHPKLGVVTPAECFRSKGIPEVEGKSWCYTVQSARVRGPDGKLLPCSRVGGRVDLFGTLGLEGRMYVICEGDHTKAPLVNR